MFALSKGIHNGLVDALGVTVETHVLQHHDGGKKEGSGIGEVLAGNVGSGTCTSQRL